MILWHLIIMAMVMGMGTAMDTAMDMGLTAMRKLDLFPYGIDCLTKDN